MKKHLTKLTLKVSVTILLNKIIVFNGFSNVSIHLDSLKKNFIRHFYNLNKKIGTIRTLYAGKNECIFTIFYEKKKQFQDCNSHKNNKESHKI